MTALITIDPRNPAPEKIAEAVAILKKGGVIAYPTETFYGLGADARNERAIEKIFSMKGRGFHNPVSVIIAGEDMLGPLVADVPNGARWLIRRFWPGPLTIVFWAAPTVSARLTAGTEKIGIRISSHPIAMQLARELGFPLTATSANLSGGAENTNAEAVKAVLRDLPDAILDGGDTPGAPGSTILDATVSPFRIIREGAIPGELIRTGA